jgi:hypothetical protein
MIEFLLLVHMTQQVADRWAPYHLSETQKQWFQQARGAWGHCCDVADGLPADDWERRYDDDKSIHYWVLLDGKWWKVPDANVIKDQGNPVGVPVVWYTTGKDNIRCFVPGPEN